MRTTWNHIADGDIPPHFEVEEVIVPFVICEKYGCGASGEPSLFFQTDWGEVVCGKCLEEYKVELPNMTYENFKPEQL